MVVILKSLVPGCLFNIIGFGSSFKSLFTTSQSYDEVKQLSMITGGIKSLDSLRDLLIVQGTARPEQTDA